MGHDQVAGWPVCAVISDARGTVRRKVGGGDAVCLRGIRTLLYVRKRY